jgi:hypothetical protein
MKRETETEGDSVRHQEGAYVRKEEVEAVEQVFYHF